MIIAGKQSLILVVPMIAILAIFGLVVVDYQEAGIGYKAKLTYLDPDATVTITGSVKLTITNNRDSVVEFTEIKVELINPETEQIFYTYEYAGGSIISGDSSSYQIDFSILVADLPEKTIDVKITGNLLWEGEYSEVDKTIPIPMEIEI